MLMRIATVILAVPHWTARAVEPACYAVPRSAVPYLASVAALTSRRPTGERQFQITPMLRSASAGNSPGKARVVPASAGTALWSPCRIANIRLGSEFW
jgi:hypothetical protein